MEKHQHTHHQTRRESLRKYYQIWEGKNVLLCKGNFMIGASIQPVIYTLMLINVPAFLEEFLIIRLFDDATFVGTLIPYIIFHVLSNFFMMRTILTDPGIIRRYNSKYVDSEELSQIPQRKIQALAKRNPCELTLSNHLMRFKYCRTCHIYRPLRTTHCHECDNCVERFDHHCPWLGVCVGKRNYRNFFMFVMSTTILIALSIFISLYRMLSSWKDVDPTDFGQFLKKEPYTIISLVYSAMFSLFLAPLLIFHIWLIKNNMTTNEFWKNTWKKVGVNPYKKKNFWSNCTSIMCLPIRASFIQFKKIVYPNQIQGKDQDSKNSSVFAKAEIPNQITLGNEKGRATPDHLLQRKESDKSNTQTNLGQHESKEENEIQLNGGPNHRTPPSSAGNDDKNRGESVLHSASLTKGERQSGSVFNMHGEPIEIVARGSGYDVKSPMTVNDDLENEKSPLSGFLDKTKARRVKPLESGSVYGTPDTYSRHNSERRAPDT